MESNGYVEIPGRPSMLQEGTYRIKEQPLGKPYAWHEVDGRKVRRMRMEAMMHVVSTIDPSGKEDTTPLARRMTSRVYEQFVKWVDMVGEFAEDGYDEQRFIVHIDAHGEVEIHKG